jgi:ribosomal protein S3
MVKEKKEIEEMIEKKIYEICKKFDEIERKKKEKGERIFDENSEVLINKKCDEIDKWMNDIEKKIEYEEKGNDME